MAFFNSSDNYYSYEELNNNDKESLFLRCLAFAGAINSIKLINSKILFCKGVPVNNIIWLQLKEEQTLKNLLSLFLSLCASSTTKHFHFIFLITL